MKRKRTAAIRAAVVAAWVVAAGPAGAAPRLTLAEAVNEAVAQHPAVEAAAAQNEDARALVGISLADWLPSLTLSGTATRYEEPMPVTPFHGLGLGQFPVFDRTLFGGAATVRWKLFDGFARGARVGGSRSQARASGAALDAARQATLAQTVAAYLDVLSRAEILQAHRHRLAALTAERGRVRQFSDAGRAAAVDLLRIEAALASAEAEAVRLETATDLAEADLARITGLAAERTRREALDPIQGVDRPLPEREALIAKALEASPQLARARWQEQAATAGVRAARGARWPELEAVGSYLGFDSPESDPVGEWNVGLRLSYPLFSGGAVGNRIARARAARRAAAAERRLTELQIRHALDLALASLRQARARVTSLQRAVDRFAEVVRIEKLLLDEGAGTQTDYIAEEAALLEARADLVAARHAEIIARVEIARVTGTLGPDWIAQNLEQTQ